MPRRALTGALACLVATVTLAACSVDSPEPAAQRNASIAVDGVVEIHNAWDTEVLVKVKDVANFDWEGAQRPDHPAPDGFQNVWLGPGERVRATLSPNPFANGSPFTLVWGDTNVTTRLQSVWKDLGGNAVLYGWALKSGECPSTRDAVTNGWRVTVECNGAYANPRTVVTLSAA